MVKNLVQSKLFFQSKDLERNIEPIVKNPISDFDKVTNKLWEQNVILNLRKSKGAVQKEAVELWIAKYKNNQDKTGLQCFLAAKVTPIKPIKSFFKPQEKVKVESKVDMVCVDKPVDLDTISPTEVPYNARPANQLPPILPQSQINVIMDTLQNNGLPADDLLSNDVVEITAFMVSLAQFCSSQTLYALTFKDYKLLSKYLKAGTIIASQHNKITEQEQDIFNLLKQISHLKVENMKNLLQTVVKKSNMIQGAIVMFAKYGTLVDPQLRALRVQISHRRAAACDVPKPSNFHITCQNDHTLSWLYAYENIVLADNKEFKAPLTSEYIFRCAELLKQTDTMDISDLLSTVGLHNVSKVVQHDCCQILTRWLPLLTVTNGKKHALVNIHEFCLAPNSFTDLLHLHEPKKGTSSEQTQDVKCEHSQAGMCDSSRFKPGPKPGHGGRPVKCEQFPEIVTKTLSFIRTNGFAANAKRRNQTVNSMGVTLDQIRKHLLDTITGLSEAGISRNTIHQLMVPPRKKTNAAKLYKGIINARIPKKSNNRFSSDHKDLHFCRSQASMFCEAAEFYSDEVIRISADDKNKVNVGTLAVSRYHQLSRFFMENDSPNYLDHDFPIPGYKITPSGYLILSTKHPELSKQRKMQRSRSVERTRGPDNSSMKQRSKSLSPTRNYHYDLVENGKLQLDTQGRLHIVYGRTGPLHVVNRAQKFQSSNSQAHANDLYHILVKPEVRGEKSAAVIKSDGGPDWSTKSQHVLVSQGRLWRDLDLDYLAVVNLAAGHSAENEIEHCWSPLSKNLASVTLPACLPREDKPPCFQSGLTQEEVKQKEAIVFDNAIDELNGYWRKQFDGYDVTPNKVSCLEKPEPYSDHSMIDNFLKTGIRHIMANEDLSKLLKEYKFLVKHCIRRTNVLEFVKCQDPECEHCTSHPIRAVRFMAYLRSLDESRMYTPTPSVTHPGHYNTWLEMNFKHVDLKKPILGLDAGCPSLDGQIPICNRGCNYVFTSNADKLRHDLLVHYEERKADQTQKRRAAKRSANHLDEGEQHTCVYHDCGLSYTSQASLRRHQHKKQHF